MSEDTEHRSAFGQSRFGGGPTRLLLASIISGGLLATLLGIAAMANGNFSHPAVGLTIFSFTVFPIATILMWVVLVDRQSLSGAVRNTEATVENTWYLRATSGALTDLVAILGIGTMIVVIFDMELPTIPLLMGILTVCLADTSARYLWLRRISTIA